MFIIIYGLKRIMFEYKHIKDTHLFSNVLDGCENRDRNNTSFRFGVVLLRFGVNFV